MAKRELRPGTIRKKQLEVETLEEFLARMTAKWHERQAKLDAKPQRALAAQLRYIARQKEIDPEGWAEKQRRYERNYRARNPEAVRRAEAARSERRRQAREAQRVAAAAAKLAANPAQAHQAKPAKRPEGYPKVLRREHVSDAQSALTAVVRQGDLARAMAFACHPSPSRPDGSYVDLVNAPAVPVAAMLASEAQAELGQRAAQAQTPSSFASE